MFHMEQFLEKVKLNWYNAPDLFFFGILLFCLPFGTRSFLFTILPYSTSIFNEWTSIFLYGTDILIILTIVFWLRRMIKFHQTFEKYGRALNIAVFAFVLIVCVSALISPFLDLGLYGAIKYIEFGLIFLYAVYSIVTNRRRLLVAVLLFASGGIQAIIAILQFINQSSLGLRILGESAISTDINNVAEIIFAGQPILRAYGTFPHPNVLAYFLIACMLLGVYIFAKIPNAYFRLSVAFLWGLQFMAFLLAFSRVAWLAASIGLIVAFFVYFMGKRGAKSQKRLWLSLSLSKKQIAPVVVSLILVLVMVIGTLVTLWPLLNPRFVTSDSNGDMAVSMRSYLNEHAIEFSSESLYIGWGPKSFVPMLCVYETCQLPDWMKQPVHNAWLGIASEIGLWGLLAFGAIIVLRLARFFKKKNVPHGTFLGDSPDLLFKSLVIGVIFAGISVMFFDHYILDVQQGSLIFWIILGI